MNEKEDNTTIINLSAASPELRETIRTDFGGEVIMTVHRTKVVPGESNLAINVDGATNIEMAVIAEMMIRSLGSMHPLGNEFGMKTAFLHLADKLFPPKGGG